MAASVSSYTLGETVRVSAAFTNALGAAADPTTVTAKIEDPSGNVTTLVYGTDAALQKLATGSYAVDVETDEAGTWFYRFIGTGTQTAGQGLFYVTAARPG